MKFIISSLAICALLVTNNSNAALESRLSGQAVYDTDLNITWLADANLAIQKRNLSSIYADGSMSREIADRWVAAINHDTYLGFNDWRLPGTLDYDTTCSNYYSTGMNCIGSEMGHLFYKDNLSSFQNIQSHSDQFYWSDWINGTGSAFYFRFSNGEQGLNYGSTGYVMLIRSGDVATVPLPAACWLLGSGLLGLIGVARRKAA